MGMEDIGPERLDRPLDRPDMCRQPGQLAQRPARPEPPRRCGTVEGQPVQRLHLARRAALARTGHRRDRVPFGPLRLQDGAGAKGIAALERQAMVEDVQDAHDDAPVMPALNAASTTGL